MSVYKEFESQEEKRTFVGEDLGDDGAGYVEQTRHAGGEEGRRSGRKTGLGEQHRSILLDAKHKQIATKCI